MKRALITGITGQDGAYLAQFLLKKGYTVFGTYRRQSSGNFWRLHYLNIFHKIKLISADTLDSTSLYRALDVSNPSEIYHLAAQSFVGHAIEDSTITLDTNIKGTLNLLSVLTEVNNKCRFYFAGSSEMFGNCGSTPQDESTPFNPRTIYGISKVSGYEIAKLFKNNYNMYVCCGILYNHESPRRANIYVTKKITNFVVDLKLGSHEKLSLGDISAKRDWGYAKDYVEAMWSIVQFASPESFVISSGELHSVEDICRIAFSYFGYNYKDFIMVKDALKRPKEKTILLGDSTKAKKLLGWSSSISFEDIINQMVEKEYLLQMMKL